MLNSISRIIIETFVRKTLKDIQDSPERSIRNLVDMALHFSEGRFQQHFFQIAQTMLENENSPYYELTKNIAMNVDTDCIVNFGMNVGYNSCQYGAKHIREIEKQQAFNIPWTVLLNINGSQLTKSFDTYDSVITQGEELGIYTWMIFFKGDTTHILTLIKNHPDSAFFLFCGAKNCMLIFEDEISDVHNLMFVIRRDWDQEFACEALRTLGFPYSLYDYYDEQNKDKILSGKYYENVQTLHPIFTILIAAPNCSRETRKIVSQSIAAIRDKQQFQTIAIELMDTCIKIDKIISDDFCFARFDYSGQLHTLHGKLPGNHYNLFQTPLQEIFQSAFQKK